MGFLKSVGRLLVPALAAGFVAVLCLAAWGWMTGVVSMANIETARKAIRGELAPPAPVKDEKPSDLASRYDAEALKEKQRAIEDLKAQEDLLLVRLNERRSEIAKLEGEAARIRKDVTDRGEALAKAQKTFADAVAAQEKLAKSAGFKKEVETFENMKEKDAARYLYKFDNDQAVELLKAFKGEFRAKAIQEIDKIDQLPENAAREPKAAALLKLILQGEAKADAKLASKPE